MRFSSYQLPARLTPRIAHLGEKLCYILFSEPKSMIWCVHVQFRFTYHCRRSRWRYHVRPPRGAVFRSRRCRYARSLGRAVSGSGIVILFVFSILIARGFFRCYFLCPHSRVHCCLLPGRSCFRFEFGFQIKNVCLQKTCRNCSALAEAASCCIPCFTQLSDIFV